MVTAEQAQASARELQRERMRAGRADTGGAAPGSVHARASARSRALVTPCAAATSARQPAGRHADALGRHHQVVITAPDGPPKVRSSVRSGESTATAASGWTESSPAGYPMTTAPG